MLLLRLSSSDMPLITMDKVSLTYPDREKPVLENVTVQITLQSRVGIIGRNGRGKSTLLQALISGGSSGGSTPSTGTNTTTSSSSSTAESSSSAGIVQIVKGYIWHHHQLKIGVVAQHQIDLLSLYLQETPISYMRHILQQQQQQQQYGSDTSAALDTLNHSTDNTNTINVGDDQHIRALLGACGLSGKLALQPIGSLSGGQKARLSFAIVCAQRPHILCLDEPSNHLSMDAIDSLIQGCQDYMGGIVIISHNQYLLTQLCNELFIVDQGKVTVRKPLVSDTTNKEEAKQEFIRLLDRSIRDQINS